MKWIKTACYDRKQCLQCLVFSCCSGIEVTSLQWRHNGHDSVSNQQLHNCLLNRWFRRRSKETSKLRATGLCAGNSPGTSEFPAQMASNADTFSTWWRHHDEERVVRMWYECEWEYLFMELDMTLLLIAAYRVLMNILLTAIQLLHKLAGYTVNISQSFYSTIRQWLSGRLWCILLC